MASGALDREGRFVVDGESFHVTPTFYKNKFFCPNRSAYKNAYQIVVHMKNFPKINLV
jgi:hypothetical protein